MAITLISSPDTHHPAYNPVHWVLDSTAKTQPGFRYVFQIYDSGTSTLLAEVKVAPRPGDGYGYCDVSKILQSKVDKTDPFTTVTFINADINSIYKYDMHMGEEFEGFLQADDFFFNNLSPIPVGQNRTSIGNSGVLGMPLIAYPFNVGDQVVVEYDPTWTPNPNPLVPGDPRSALIGTFNVIAITSLGPGPSPGFPYEIVISLPWIGSGFGLPLKIRYADGRKNRVLNQIIVTDQVTYNAAFSFPAFQVYNQVPYLPADPTKLFMTSIPRDCFIAYPWQEFYHQILTGPNVTSATTINFLNSNGGQYSDPLGAVLPASELQFNVSPGITWPTQVSGTTGPVVGPTTEWYEYWLNNCTEEDCCNVTLRIQDDITPGSGQTYNLTSQGIYEDRCWFTFNYEGEDFIIFFWSGYWFIAYGTDPNTPGSIVYEWILPESGCPPLGQAGWSQFTPGPITWGWRNPVLNLTPIICQELTERLRIYIDRDCPINQTQVLFMDRLGSWSSYAFPLRTLESGSVERRQLRREAGDIKPPSNKWSYNSWDRGLSNYHIEHSKEFTLNTEWMPDCMSVYFEELITSPYTYIKFDADIKQDFDPNKWYSIQVLDTQWRTTRAKNKRLIRYTIRVRTSIDNPINI